MNYLFRVLFYFASLAIVAVSVGMLGADSPRTNLPYKLWKSGLLRYNEESTLRLFQHDHGFHRKLRGKRLREVESLFPILVLPEHGNEYQRQYDWFTDEKAFRWIGDTEWGIVLEDDRVQEIVRLKG